MSQTPWWEQMADASIAQAEAAERLLRDVAAIRERNDMSTVQIPELMQWAEIHSRLALTYAQLATASREGR